MKRYFYAFLIFLFIEIAIAYFHFNPFIRGFLGDVLVILLLYSFLKIFIRHHVLKIALAVLSFAFLVELLQFLNLAENLNIHSKILLTVIGSVFDVWDLIAYCIGFLLVLTMEKYILKNKPQLFPKH